MIDSFDNPMLNDPFDATLPNNPYPGLRPFYSSEWTIFFGRETITDEIINSLINKHLIIVHGDSGSGKSSLVRAGVLVQLQQSHTANGQTWRTCAILPRNNPLDRLAEALAGLITKKPSFDRTFEIRKILDRGKFAPVLLSTLLREANDDRVCILIDQFEELFRFAREHNHQEAQVFIDILTGISTGKTPGLYAILTMRSEFLGSCSHFQNFAETLNNTQYLLPQIDYDALRRAIQEPAKLYGGEVSTELAEKLIADVRGNQDELPLIQHGLIQLWHQHTTGIDQPRHNLRLDIKDIELAQSLEALLDQHASFIQRDLLKRNNKLANLIEHVFRSLTDINADGKAIRRPLSYGHLKRDTGAEDVDLHEVLNAFRAEGVNFITFNGSDNIGNDVVIDISHEAFIRAWSQLTDPKEGWLWKEFHAGLTWRALQFQADRFIENPKDRLSAISFTERAVWISLLPSPFWCERYGNEQSKVIKLFSALNYRVFKIWGIVFMSLYLPYAICGTLAIGDPDNRLSAIPMLTITSVLFGLPAYFCTRRWIRGRRARLLVQKFFTISLRK